MNSRSSSNGCARDACSVKDIANWAFVINHAVLYFTTAIYAAQLGGAGVKIEGAR